MLLEQVALATATIRSQLIAQRLVAKAVDVLEILLQYAATLVQLVELIGHAAQISEVLTLR